MFGPPTPPVIGISTRPPRGPITGSATLPAAALGSDYLIFVTNLYGVENQYYNAQGETSYSNNTYAVLITLYLLFNEGYY